MFPEIRWPTVAFFGLVVVAVVAIFALAGPDERTLFLGILSVLGTAGAAVMRAAFGVSPASPPQRIEEAPDLSPPTIPTRPHQRRTMTPRDVTPRDVTPRDVTPRETPRDVTPRDDTDTRS